MRGEPKMDVIANNLASSICLIKRDLRNICEVSFVFVTPMAITEYTTEETC